MLKDIDKLRSAGKTPQDLNYIEDLRLELSKTYRKDECLRDNRIYFYDFPATVCMYRCMNGIEDASKWKNDLQKLGQVYTDYITCLDSSKMQKQVLSPRTFKFNQTIVQRMIKELGETEWKNYIDSTPSFVVESADED